MKFNDMTFLKFTIFTLSLLSSQFIFSTISYKSRNNFLKFTENTKFLLENTYCQGCTCDNENNKRPVLPDKIPSKLIGYKEIIVTQFPLTSSITWNNSIKDVDINLKSTSGILFPDGSGKMKEFNDQVQRTEANSANQVKQESQTINSKLPKGEYLLSVYNCSNEDILVKSDVKIKISSGPTQILSLDITPNLYYVNDRVWRIAVLDSDGNGKIKMKVINKVSSDRSVKFDGIIAEPPKENSIPKISKKLTDSSKPMEAPKNTSEDNNIQKGKAFCEKYCIPNSTNPEKKCLSSIDKEIKICKPCKAKNDVKVDLKNDAELLCKKGCNNMINETKCDFYGYFKLEKKNIEEQLLKKFGI